MTGKKSYHQGESYVAVVYHDAYCLFIANFNIANRQTKYTSYGMNYIMNTHAMRIKTTHTTQTHPRS